MVAGRDALVPCLLILSHFTGNADAFWRMPCRSRTGVARIDPLVMPGQIADHAHVIHGAGNFDIDVKATELKNAKCTSCAVTQDKSAYWTPSLHFMYPNGTTVMVPQTGGMLVYYLLNPPNWDGTGQIYAFPEGFQMLAGDKNLRNFTGPVPDPLWYTWTPEQSTQFALSQKAVGFNCLNYNAAPEPSFYRHSMPDRALIDSQCTNGVRAELMFPSCWDGKNLDSSDHRSHVAYPKYVQGGTCPDGYPKKLPGLIFETIWNTWEFKGIPGQFIWSQGDPTGNGYHGDFMNGWTSIDLLQKAVDTCTNLSGLIEDCPVFDIQSDYTAAECTFKTPALVAKDNIVGPRQGLPIGVPVQSGPEYATNFKIISNVNPTSTATPSKVSSPTSTTTSVKPAGSSATSSVSAPVKAATPGPSSPVTTPSKTFQQTTVIPTSTTKSHSSATGPQLTPRPPLSTPLPSGLQILSTTYVTMPSEVLEIIVVRKTTTLTVDALPTMIAMRQLAGKAYRALGR